MRSDSTNDVMLAKNPNCFDLQPTEIGTKTETMGTEVFDHLILKEFETSEDASYILQETKKQLKNRYSSVYDDTNKKLITFPAQYNFRVGKTNNDKARAMQYGDEDLIKQRIKQLKKTSNLEQEDKRELKHLTEVLKKKQPLSWESSVVLRMRNYFANEPGLCLHGYKAKDYLIRYIELAKDLRKNDKAESSTSLSSLERSIVKLLGRNPSDIDEWVKNSMKEIENERKNVTSQTTALDIFTGKMIHDALNLNRRYKSDRKERAEKLKKLLPIFQAKWDEKQKKMVDILDQEGRRIRCQFSKDEIISKLYKVEYERSIQKFNHEFDCLMLLAKHRLILDVEAKHPEDKTSNNNRLKATKAAKQLKKREEYVRKTFGHLLDKGWRYVPIVALDVPSDANIKRQCNHCSPFILTNGTVAEQLREMDDLMDLLTSTASTNNDTEHTTGHQDFKHAFSRLLGLSGLLLAIQKVSAYHNIMGTEAKSINAGWTQASALKFARDQNDVRVGDIVGRPHDIYKLVFFNPDQIGLLALEHKSVVFLDDYGAGKFSYVKIDKVQSYNEDICHFHLGNNISFIFRKVVDTKGGFHPNVQEACKWRRSRTEEKGLLHLLGGC